MTDLFFNYVVRNFAKYIYKAFCPKSYKHNRRYWPFYRVIRNSDGYIESVYFRNKLIADHRSNIRVSNHACMLVATGPSAKHIPTKFINNDQVDFIGVNGSIALSNINFKHYVIIDHDFVQHRFDLVQQVLTSDCNLFTTIRCMDEILKRVSIDQIVCVINIIEIYSSGKIERLMQPSQQQDIHHPNYFFHQNFGFSLNYRDATFDYYTVAYTALQIAFGLDYTTIYMIGVDLNNLNQPRFYETEEHKQPTWLNQHLDAILTAFYTASLASQQQNIRVYNLSEHSLLECFPKRSFTEDNEPM
ncbi:lipopolysaccharide biosynthesis protein [Acinetobacter sp. 194]|uniref:lipopolysaccharide biosynthesis protein n=1 Tax=Acinetobacter shaoyimingii TaxID=2715164 RepID=UPI00140A153C|nr:lipopolysaccharide biosynthesis protein [Acinetobacter shaoyimingii]NHB58717.1 lipopolysaccharide biosynthesis protein [Acinetobacter shaoyimingii]